jgi:ribonuclease P protein component
VLPAERRVRRREDFAAAVRHGRRIGAAGLVIHACNDGSSRPARAGFVVGRSVGLAVVRNRVRRQLRHLIRPYLAQLPTGSVLILRATGQPSGRELSATVATLAERARTALTAPPAAVSR